MSALKLGPGGRCSFLVGAEDLCVPACYATASNVPLLVLTVVAFVQINREPECEDNRPSRLEVFRVAFIALYSLLCATDLAILVASALTRLFRPNRVLHALLYARALLSALTLCFTCVGTAWIVPLRDEPCISENDRLYNMNLAIIIVSWIVSATVVGLAVCAYNGSAGRSPEEAWERRIRFWTCAPCWEGSSTVQNDPHLFKTIAEDIAHLFQMDGVVASDVATGLMLVKAMQVEKAERGEKRFFVADSNEEPAVAEQAASGIQPALSDAHWGRIAAARYFYKYAVGAYGWPLFGWMDPARFACCATVGCCLELSDAQREHYDGVTCCHSSVKAFLIRTGIERDDLLCVHLHNDVHAPCYYVCVDRPTKTLVVAIRGTLSGKDAVTDLNAKHAPFLGGRHYAHAGILRVAEQLLADITEKGVLSDYVEQHRDYSVLCVGHSLGAACACLLALLLRERLGDGTIVRAVSYAPPLLMDKALAEHPDTKRVVTSVVYNKDLICRLSLRSMDAVRLQMNEAFRCTTLHNKFQIALRSWRRDYLGLVDSDGASKHYHAMDERARVSPANGEEEESEAASVVVAIDVDAEAREAKERWEPFYTPGMIYHIVRKRPPPSAGRGCCCSSADETRYTVYPAAAAGFQEIMVDPSMGLDHFPDRYWDHFEDIALPERFTQHVSSTWE